MKRSISGWLIAIVFLAVAVGIAGGGVMGAAGMLAAKEILKDGAL